MLNVRWTSQVAVTEPRLTRPALRVAFGAAFGEKPVNRVAYTVVAGQGPAMIGVGCDEGSSTANGANIVVALRIAARLGKDMQGPRLSPIPACATSAPMWSAVRHRLYLR